MALIKCKECGKEISDKAQACPSCGAPQSSSVPPPLTPPIPNYTTAEQQAKMTLAERREFQKAGGKLLLTTGQKFTFAVMGFIFLFLLVKCVGSTSEDVPEVKDVRHDAAVACRMFIERNLNDPSSAEFDSPPIVVDNGSGIWSVQYRYRAKNSFGAQILTTTICKMKYDGKDYALLQLK